MSAILIYDGQCPFCTRSARRLQVFAGSSRLSIAPMDAPGTMELHRELDYARTLKAVQLILENGYLCEGAEAGFNAVALRPGFGFLKFFYYLPVIRQISDLAYKIVARNRSRCDACRS